MSDCPVLFHSSRSVIISGHQIPRIFRRHLLTKACSFCIILFVTNHVSQPFSRSDLTQALKSLILKCRLMFSLTKRFSAWRMHPWPYLFSDECPRVFLHSRQSWIPDTRSHILVQSLLLQFLRPPLFCCLREGRFFYFSKTRDGFGISKFMAFKEIGRLKYFPNKISFLY